MKRVLGISLGATAVLVVAGMLFFSVVASREKANKKIADTGAAVTGNGDAEEGGPAPELVVPSTHPRIWFNEKNLPQARAWYKTHPFKPRDTADSRYFLGLAVRYLMSGNPADCKIVIDNAMGQVYSDEALAKAGPDEPRQNGDSVIVAAYDWCYSQLTPTQKSTLETNWNHYMGELNRSHGVNKWGGPDMVFSNYNWGYLRNDVTWGMAIYDHDKANGKAWLDDGLNVRWSQHFVPVANRAGPAGGLGGMPQEGSEYGRYLVWYSILPFVSAKQMGRDVYNESSFFPGLVYWLIYETPLAQSENLGWQPFPWADDENWAGGNEILRGDYYPDFMNVAANYWKGTNLSKYARQWLKMTDAATNPWVAAVDTGGPAESFSALPLDYYAPGYQQMYGQSAWSAGATRFMWQMGQPNGVGHEHRDWGTFQIWKNGRWLTRESVGYSQPLVGPSGNGLVDINSVFAHNGVFMGGVQTKSEDGEIKVSRLESQPGYSYAEVNLGLAGPKSWVREFVFLRDLETTVILDRLNTSGANTSATFILHSETDPKIEDSQHITITNAPEALRMTMLEPAKPSVQVVKEVVKEGGPGQFRIEATNSNPGNDGPYFITVLQAKHTDAANLSPSVVDSNPRSPSEGTFTITLDADHSVAFQKGLTSSGGGVVIHGVQTSFRKDVEPIKVDPNGIKWGQ